jgi:hypothetical protein
VAMVVASRYLMLSTLSETL